MPFADFVKTTVMLSAAAATTLAALTMLTARDANDTRTATVAIGWWAVATAIGLAMGRQAAASPPITKLLRGAKTVHGTLPPPRPLKVVLSRLWPVLVTTVVAGGLAFVAPQIPAVATGFALIWALAWRQQHAAIVAIERRDGVSFHVDQTSPWKPITLTRTPGFKAYLPAERTHAA